MMLCDAAQASEGKLFILGGGWTITGPTPVPHAIAMIVHVPWTDANRRLKMTLALLSADGKAVTQQGPFGEVPVQIDGEFEVGRPVGVAQGSSIDVPLAITVPPLPLPAGGRFVWKLTLDADTSADWELPFATRPTQTFPGGVAGVGPAGMPGPSID